MLQRAIILSPGTTLALATPGCRRAEDAADPGGVDPARGRARHIRNVLETARWRIEGPSGAAQVLGHEAEHAAQPHAEAGDRPAALNVAPLTLASAA